MVCDMTASVCVRSCDDVECDPASECVISAGQADCVAVADAGVDGGGCTGDDGCADEEYCDDGQCLDDVCVPGVEYCDGSDVHRCAANGSGTNR